MSDACGGGAGTGCPPPSRLPHYRFTATNETHRMNKLFATIALAAVIGTSAPATAESLGRYTGNIVLSTKSVGFIVGAEWGER